MNRQPSAIFSSWINLAWFQGQRPHQNHKEFCFVTPRRRPRNRRGFPSEILQGNPPRDPSVGSPRGSSRESSRGFPQEIPPPKDNPPGSPQDPTPRIPPGYSPGSPRESPQISSDPYNEKATFWYLHGTNRAHTEDLGVGSGRVSTYCITVLIDPGLLNRRPDGSCRRPPHGPWTPSHSRHKSL